MGTSMNSTNIKVIERVAFSQDKCLAICKVCGSYYLIGVASQNIKILAELDPSHFQSNSMNKTEKVNFIDFFVKAKKQANDT